MLSNPRRAVVEFIQLSPEEVRQILSNSEVVHYIRHTATVQLLEQLAGRQLASGGQVYTYQPGDVVIMAVLRAPQRGQDVTVRLEDLIFYRIIVHHLE
jgi:hypothetical protein